MSKTPKPPAEPLAPTLPSIGATKGPSSSGEHEAVRRLHQELDRGDELAEQIRRGQVPSSPTPPPPDEGPITLRKEEVERLRNQPPTRQSQPLILVADDDAALRSALAETLRDAGYRVREAENGLVALQQILDSPPAPDCIVLDLWMPVLSGHGVRAALAADGHHIPILIVTASDFATITRADPSLTGDVVVIKSSKLTDELLDKIERRVREYREIPKGLW